MTVPREKERRKSKGLVKFCYKPSEGEKEEREREGERACGVVLQLKDRRRAQGTTQDRPRWSR